MTSAGCFPREKQPTPPIPENLEIFALTLLLTTPCRLQCLWLNFSDVAVWEEELTVLGFSGVAAAADFMDRLKDRRMFFEGVGTLLMEMDEYPEPPPHPANNIAAEIVRRLREP